MSKEMILEQPLNEPSHDKWARPAKEKKTYTFMQRDFWGALWMLPLGFLYLKLMILGGPGLGITIFTLLFTPALIYWARVNRLRLKGDSLVYLGLMLLCAAYFALYDNAALKDLALILLHLLCGYLIATINRVRIEDKLGSFMLYDLADSLLFRPLGHFGAGPAVLKTGIGNSQKGRGLLLLLCGLVLAIPACVVVSGLLQQADAAFSELWLRITGSFLSDLLKNFIQFLISLPFACYFFALLFGGRAPRQDDKKVRELATKARFLPGLLALGAITPLLIIYIIFFCSQSAYFLSAFSGLLPVGYNYAEYARRGFFELCTVSSINLAIIFALLCFCKKEPLKTGLYHLYTLLLSLFSLALIAISLRKMLLYIQIYGLTPLRLYTSWFMLLLALVFIFVIVKTYLPRFNAAKWTAIATVTMFFILCFANPDLQIARYNVRGYLDGRLPELDVATLGELGDGSTPYLLEILELEQLDTYSKVLARQILSARANRPEQDWRSFNLTSHNSRQVLFAQMSK